jgi:hypothetical protein
MDKTQAIRAMLDGKIVIDNEGTEWRYLNGKFECFSTIFDRYISSWSINSGDNNDWRLGEDE